MQNSSFLPEDYLAQKAERRTNIICLALFAVVMAAVFGAFLVTNQQWSKVKTQQQQINTQYQEASQQIRDLTELEQQKDAMMEKAELASALVERVPRSILLAELINRMPEKLSLLELDLKSTKIVAPRAPTQTAAPTTGRLSDAPSRGQTKKEAAQVVTKIEAPRYQLGLKLIGVAPSDFDVSRFMAELNGYSLIADVTLDYSEEKEIEGRPMRQFKISMTLDPDADVRAIDPKNAPQKIRNPMEEETQVIPPPSSTASVPTDEDPADN